MGVDQKAVSVDIFIGLKSQPSKHKGQREQWGGQAVGVSHLWLLHLYDAD